MAEAGPQGRWPGVVGEGLGAAASAQARGQGENLGIYSECGEDFGEV